MFNDFCSVSIHSDSLRVELAAQGTIVPTRFSNISRIVNFNKAHFQFRARTFLSERLQRYNIFD